MRSLSSVGLGLSIVFGFLLLALAAELYYLLWWKRRITNRDFYYMFCLKNPSSSSSSLRQSQEPSSSTMTDSDPNLNTVKDFFFKPFGDDPVARFLFTIVEETKEDLESEDGFKSRRRGDNKGSSRSRSLSDLIISLETPYLTPLASPPFLTPSFSPLMNTNNHHSQTRFNQLLESAAVRSSPPSKFKFLEDAEEKLQSHELVGESLAEVQKNDGFSPDYGKNNASGSEFLNDEEDGPFITIIVDRDKEREVDNQNHQLLSASSQVLPPASVPSTLMSANKSKSHLPLSQ